MGKKMHQKYEHKRESKLIEEGSRDDDKNKIEADNDEKKDRIKKRKAEFDTDKKESQKAHKKHKKSKDVVGAKNISVETCLGGKENTEQESSKAMNLENNEEAERARKGRHKKKYTDEFDAVGTRIETLEHSKMQEAVEAHKIYSPEDISKTMHRKVEANEKRKKKNQNPEKVNANVADDITVMSSITSANVAGKESSAGIEIECSKLQDIGGDAENGNGRKKKKKSKAVKNDSQDETLEHSTESVESHKICSPEDINKTVHGKEQGYEKRKKEKKNGNEMEHGKLRDTGGDAEDGNGHKKKKKSKSVEKDSESGCHKGDARTRSVETSDQGYEKRKKEKKNDNEMEHGKLRDTGGDAEDGNGRKKKKKSKSVEKDFESGRHKGDARTRSVETSDQVENATPKEKSKKVSFSDQVEIFPSKDVTDDANKHGEEGLVYAKRYSKEEDEILMKAVDEYIDYHNLGDEGINMVLNSRGHKEVRNCWKEIQKAIPWRPVASVYHRCHVLLERDGGKHQWTPEELETIRNFVEKHGPKWRLLADSLGKFRHHVKDAWRRIKLTNCNKGKWKQEEYQSLFDLVNMDLSMKANEERMSKHGMLRDNICWTAISDKMQTRPFVHCCTKWYRQLTSPMVAEGIWADVDDYRMLDALSSLDACCMEDVDWDNLIDGRSGDLCRKRWGQMVHHLATKDMSFSEQVDVLAERYRPNMVEARETYDSKVPIDLP